MRKVKAKGKKFFAKNEGKSDRIIRLIVGIVLIGLGYRYSPWIYILAAISFLTAIDGFCMLYKILGISTIKKK